MPIISSLKHPFAKASMSIFNDLCRYGNFHSNKFDDEMGIHVLRQEFRHYKTFFKELRKNCLPTEFVFSLNEIKNRISNLNEEIYSYADRDEYWSEYPFDYMLVVKFIERYISLFKYYHSELLYQYCFDLQKEMFLKNYDTKKRLGIIKKHLEIIYFNEKYGKKFDGFTFGGMDYGFIYGIKQKDAKHFFESEIIKEEYKELKEKISENNDYYIDLSKNKLAWKGTQTELIELIKALIENGSIKGASQKNIIDLFAKFLNINIKHPDKIIQDIKKRNNDSETLFLDKLKSTLYDYTQK